MTESLGTHSQDAAGRQEAGRELLQRPIITAARDPELLSLIRKHATALKSTFASELGYTLIVESTFARLVKTPLEPTAPTRALRRPNGVPLGASSYTLLALTGAALLAPGMGDQVLVSTLAARVREDAAAQGIALSENITDRRRLVAALQVLVEWGLLGETDGTVTAWGDNAGNDALLSVARPLLSHLLTNPLGPDAEPADVLTGPSDNPRQRLRRRLVENPVSLRRDLGDDELDVLAREKTELTRELDEDFGLTVEVRAEGVLAYDSDARLSDIEFPGSGSLKQATLLLVGELVERLPVAQARTDLLAPWSLVDEILSELTAENERSWKQEYVDSVSALRTDVVALLQDFRMAESRENGLALHAHAARYRPTTGSPT
ncbi:TIGR02678 family protein [Actinomycetes bacterium M1A6_2h]